MNYIVSGLLIIRCRGQSRHEIVATRTLRRYGLRRVDDGQWRTDDMTILGLPQELAISSSTFRNEIQSIPEISAMKINPVYHQ